MKTIEIDIHDEIDIYYHTHIHIYHNKCIKNYIEYYKTCSIMFN